MGAQRRDFTYVEDAVEGLLRLGLCAAETAQIVNLATGRLTSVRDFVLAAASVLSIEPSRLRFGELPSRADEMEHDEVAIARLRGLVDWTPRTSIRDGVRRTVEFERDTSR
jgi:UDP-glucuronate decarboxylase